MADLERMIFHSEHTDCYTYFKIVGDFDPDEITELLGIVPEKHWKIGDRRKNGTLYDFACWQTGTCREFDYDVSVQMMKTLAPLLDKTDILNEIKIGMMWTLYLKLFPLCDLTKSRRVLRRH